VNILVFGAGVIGSLYAGKLQEGGNLVTVLARGERLEEIRRNGLVLEDIVSGHHSTIQVATTDVLRPDDAYDIALITVRLDQLESVMPALQSNPRIPTIVFMLNNPSGSADLITALGKARVILGFPGAGGTREAGVVRYAIISQQPTTIGEFDGTKTARLLNLVKTFRAAGLQTRIESNMDAWLKTHAFFVTAVCGAIYLAGGDCRKLSRDDATLELMVEAIIEGFAAVRALGLPVTPFALKVLFRWLPTIFVVMYWRKFFSRNTAEYAFGRHARNAAAEMLEVASDCRRLLEKSGVKAPALQQLYGAIETFVKSQ
jgi:2-dehydropantoate 2-reductase